MPVRLNKPQREFVQAIVSADDTQAKRARRMLMAEVRERWFHDLARLYPQAIAAIEAALAPTASVHMRVQTAKWLVEQRRGMMAEEREAEVAEVEAAPAEKPASEMTRAELEASITSLERLVAAEKAEDAQIVPEPSIFD